MVFPSITSKTLPAKQFNELLLPAGYTQLGTAPAQDNRIKTWWTHSIYARVEAIYSPDGAVAITAYHVS
ncbi:MAG: hypothetical protein KME42_24510 [Tildeniella nuda ZEHNDER 1965/U140]|jgi:hypothetical protein|nr:hypothetical protein [Tildeniella nuda ZEHNDER 1965/U140]